MPLPPRSRNGVNSPYLPACRFPAPGDPRRLALNEGTSRKLRQKARERNQTQTSDEFVVPTPIIPARDALEFHRANSGAYPMVK